MAVMDTSRAVFFCTLFFFLYPTVDRDGSLSEFFSPAIFNNHTLLGERKIMRASNYWKLYSYKHRFDGNEEI